MSFEVFMQCFDRGRAAGVAVHVVRTAFAQFAPDSEPSYWHLVYDDANSCHVAITPDEEHEGRITALTIHRPCGDSRLWESLYRVLKSGQWVLYFPAEKPPLVMADNTIAQHLPADMRDALGPVRVVHSGDEIVQIIRSS